MSRSITIQKNIFRSGDLHGSAGNIAFTRHKTTVSTVIVPLHRKRGMVLFGAAEAIAPRPFFSYPFMATFAYGNDSYNAIWGRSFQTSKKYQSIGDPDCTGTVFRHRKVAHPSSLSEPVPFLNLPL